MKRSGAGQAVAIRQLEGGYKGMEHVSSPSPASPFLSVKDAAQILGISQSSVYGLTGAWLASNGATGIPCVRLGRRILVPRAAVDEWAAVGVRSSQP